MEKTLEGHTLTERHTALPGWKGASWWKEPGPFTISQDRAPIILLRGVDVQGLLPFGKPEEIKEEVSRLQRLFGDTGGYILSTGHVIMDEIPVENALALYNQARG